MWRYVAGLEEDLETEFEDLFGDDLGYHKTQKNQERDDRALRRRRRREYISRSTAPRRNLLQAIRDNQRIVRDDWYEFDRRIAGQHPSRPLIEFRDKGERIRGYTKKRKDPKLWTGVVPAGTMILPVLKWLTTVDQRNLSTTITPVLINGVPNGFTQNERLANRITVLKIQITGYYRMVSSISSGLSGQNLSQIMRFNVVLDSHPNKALPSVGDIWRFTTTTNSLRDLENTKRFTVLWNHVEFFNPQVVQDLDIPGQGFAIRERHAVNWFKTVNIPIKYDGSGSTIASLTKNSLLFYAFQEDTAPVMGINLNIRIRYLG